MNTSKIYKITAIVPRFSTMIRGGAEKHAYDVLSVFPENCEITILTSTALDYVSWNNFFKPGEEKFERFRIERYLNLKTRKMKKFNQLSNFMYAQMPNQTSEDESIWLEEQGPYCPALLNRIEEIKDKSDLFVFFSYLYYPILKGIKLVTEKSILVPMFHDEIPVYLAQYKQVYNDTIYYAFNTPEEKNLFEKIFHFTPSRHSIIGTYIQEPESKSSLSLKKVQKQASEPKILLTIGRMDLGKGIFELVQLFQHWIANSHENIELHLIGSNPPKLISKFESENIRFLGALDESEKYETLRNSLILINPSSVESFSIVIMEAWSQGIPVLVNGKSDVLRGHCKRSNGGLWYKDEESFSAVLSYMTSNEAILNQMGINGKNYVQSNFTKDIITEKWKKLLRLYLS